MVDFFEKGIKYHDKNVAENEEKPWSSCLLKTIFSADSGYVPENPFSVGYPILRH